MIKDARFSDDRRYRYWLLRSWAGPDVHERGQRTAVFVGLNPSIADEERDDPTIIREVGFAKREGYDRLIKMNLFGLITTRPVHLRDVEDPIGPDNDAYLFKLTDALNVDVICAWGGSFPVYWRPRVHAVARRLRAERTCYALGFTKAGEPRHPLYLRSDTPLQRWEAA